MYSRLAIPGTIPESQDQEDLKRLALLLYWNPFFVDANPFYIAQPFLCFSTFKIC